MYTHVLVPVAPDHEGCGEVALSAANSLLDDDGRITILHVRELIPAFIASQIPEEVVDNILTERKQELNDLAKRTTAKVNVAIVSGHPARAIVDYAAAANVDCIVIASHHPGISDYFLGSTAAWVARHADRSVHIVR